MKKNSLTTAILAGVAGVAGLAGVAHAVNLNPDGLGQVLLYPYYTVNGGNSTLITVVNTTDRVKAVKVRFVEALNSLEVLDFNLYLSPFDVWAANVVASGTGGAMLRVTDTSCTVPNIINGQEFLPYEYQSNNPDALRNHDLRRTRQGHLEIIEMGVVGGYLAAAATHTSSGSPLDCEALHASWEDATEWGGNPSYLVTPPTGGLFGGATIISGEFGRTLSYNAEALDAFFVPDPELPLTLHTNPGLVAPSLGNAFNYYADGAAQARVFSNGNLYEIDYTLGIDAVSAAFQSRYIYNEYNLNANLNAASEWVITFPTKRFYVHTDGAPRLPFTSRFNVSVQPSGLAYPGSCHAYEFRYWNREEKSTSQGLTVSPPAPQQGFALCWEANVLAFGQTLSSDTPTRILGATPSFGARGLSGFAFQEGWARLEFDAPAAGFQYWLPSNDGQALLGQPVTGFWASEVINTNVEAGVRANYGVIHKHRVSRDCRTHTLPTQDPPAGPILGSGYCFPVGGGR